MPDYATRAEVETFEKLAAIVEATGCTTPESMDADKWLRNLRGSPWHDYSRNKL